MDDEIAYEIATSVLAQCAATLFGTELDARRAMGCASSKNVSAENNTWVPAAKPIIFETSTDGSVPTDTVLIFLHGIAGEEKEFEGPLKALFAGRPGLRVVLPTSPATADRLVHVGVTSV